MSLALDLGEDYIKLPPILEQFEKDLIPAEKQLEKKGKLLEVAISENSANMHYYDARRTQLHSLVKYFMMEEERVRGEWYRKYNENYSLNITIQMMKKYIDAEPEYLTVHKLRIEVEEVYEAYCAVVEAFKQRNFELSNMTKIRVANLEFSEI
jgi:hypothetical protein